MRKSKEHFQALEHLDHLTSGKSVQEAINLIDQEISKPSNAHFRGDFEVQKALTLWGAGRKEESVQTLEQCAAEFRDLDSAHYFAGEQLLELGQFQQAMGYLTRCIDIAGESGDDWYVKAAHLLRAYCAAKVGDVLMAQHDLMKADDNDAMEWLLAEPIVSKRSIENMIG